jgi:hypothetical protein
MRRFLLVASLVVAAVVAAAPSATADVPPAELTGEAFFAFEIPVESGSSEITGTCNPTGVSNFSFHVTGFAAGPFPGSFDESGTFSVGPAPTFGLLSFQSSFTILAADATITGTKTLTSGGVAFGVCNSFIVGGDLAIPTDNVQMQATVDYTAQITTVAGTSTDTGTSFVDYGDTRVRGVPNLQEFSFSETYTSTAFLNTPGRATGGGQIQPGVSFGFVAMSDGVTPKGVCDVVDKASAVRVKCLDVTAYTQSGTHAAFKGDATVNGVPTTYRIDVDDVSEPNNGSDAFRIVTGTGYSVGGQVTSGNIQVH